MARNRARETAAYKAWRRQVLTKCEPICYRCGLPVDMTLPGTNPEGPSAEHVHALAEGGDITPSLEDSAISHLRCNKQHGGRLGAAKTNASKQSTSPNRVLQKPHPTPAFALRLTPPEGAPSRAKASPIEVDGITVPRLETKQSPRTTGSYGERAEEWLGRVYGMQVRGWQRYALHRLLEHDADGDLVWSTGIITVARQSGKSYLARAINIWRMMEGAEIWGEEQTVLSVANKRDTALEIMRPAGLWVTENFGAKHVKWGNTSAGINLDGNRWLVHAANDSAGVGYSVSQVLVDEAWKVKRTVVEDSLAPTMAERRSPQLLLVSTAGDSESDLLMAYRQRALDRLESPDPGSVLLLEWSAPPEADPDDPETWRWASPEWSEKRQTFIAQQWANIETSAFLTQYLNMWVARADHWLTDSAWQETLDASDELDPAAVWCVALECDFDGLGHAVAVAGPTVKGHIGVRVTTHRTIPEADVQLAALRAQHPQLHIMVTPGYIDRLRQKFDKVVGQREAPDATRTLLDLLDRRELRHDGSQTLLEHLHHSNISKRQGGWVMAAPMGRGGIYAARAVMFAASQAAKTPKPTAMIYSRKRGA